jgi:FkbM family methyltransferase
MKRAAGDRLKRVDFCRRILSLHDPKLDTIQGIWLGIGMVQNSSDRDSATQFLVKLPLLGRFKAVKELFINKLDWIVDRLGTSTQASLETDNVLLKGATRSLEILQRLQIQQGQILEQLQRPIQQQLEQMEVRQAEDHQTLQAIQQQMQAITFEQSLRVVRSEDYALANLEVGLMRYLYSFLPSRQLLDIGANVGEVSEQLLQAGYDVYAFEPHPPTFEALKTRLSDHARFHAYAYGIGSQDQTLELHVAQDLSGTSKYRNPTLYNSLIAHSMLEDLQFTTTVSVPVRSLASLHAAEEVPDQVGIVKIDTEGFDLAVIHGMGEHRYPVVITEFWDSAHVFGRTQTQNRLDEIVPVMKQRGYHWHIVLYRIDEGRPAFYCNYAQSVERSWGNVCFFQDYLLFTEGLKWCSAVMPMTFFQG